MVPEDWRWLKTWFSKIGSHRRTGPLVQILTVWLIHLILFVPDTYKVKERPISHVVFFMKTEEVPVMPPLLLPRLALGGIFLGSDSLSLWLESPYGAYWLWWDTLGGLWSGRSGPPPMVMQGVHNPIRYQSRGPTGGMIKCRDSLLVEQFKLMFINVFPLASRKSLVKECRTLWFCLSSTILALKCGDQNYRW